MVHRDANSHRHAYMPTLIPTSVGMRMQMSMGLCATFPSPPARGKVPVIGSLVLQDAQARGPDSEAVRPRLPPAEAARCAHLEEAVRHAHRQCVR